MVGVLAHIARLHREAVGDLALQGDVPAVGNRRAVVRVGGMQPDAGKAGCRRGSYVGNRAAAGGAERSEALIERHLACGDPAVGADAAPLAHQVHVPRGVGCQAVEFAGSFLEARPREGRAQHRLVIEAVCQSQPGQEVGNAVVLVVKSAAVAVLPGELDLAGVHAEIGHAVVYFVDRREELPADAEVHSELVVDAPVVLDECAQRRVALAHRAGEPQTIPHVRGKPEEEVGFGVARVGSVEGNLSRGAVVAGRWNVIVAIANELEAHAQRVSSFRPDDGIRRLDGGLVEDLRPVGGAEGEGAVQRAAHLGTCK